MIVELSTKVINKYKKLIDNTSLKKFNFMVWLAFKFRQSLESGLNYLTYHIKSIIAYQINGIISRK